MRAIELKPRFRDATGNLDRVQPREGMRRNESRAITYAFGALPSLS